MHAFELQRIATRLANSAHVRYWLHWNYPVQDPWIMAMQVIARGAEGRFVPVQVRDLDAYGFKWDEEDRQYYIHRNFERMIPVEDGERLLIPTDRPKR